jgi:hypothetical protein
MSLKQFSDTLYAYYPMENKEFLLGKFTFSQDGYLSSARTFFHISDISSLTGSERFRIKIGHDKNRTGMFDVSSWSYFKDVQEIYSTGMNDWIGFVRADFNKYYVQSGKECYLSIEIDGIGSNPDQIGVVYDYPIQVYQNIQSSFQDNVFATQIFVEEK